jgi:aromatic-L-amino-acid/L-tryptophan decarboxylase
MPPGEFRSLAHEAVEWVTRYLTEAERLPVLPLVRPGELRAALPPRAPEEGEPGETLLREFADVVAPALTHWNHPGFLAYFSITGSAPGILAELLAAAVNQNAMLWRTSPAGTELELLVVDWLRELMGLPEGFFGVIQDTASTSSMVALAAARHRTWPGSREAGLAGLPPSRVYASEDAHSSIDKAAITLGLGLHAVRRVPTDARFRMAPDALRSAVLEDQAAGVRPMAVVATVGTTSTTAADPVDQVGAVARELDLWLHVDAAYAGPAAILPEKRELFRGWEGADSIVVNPHKWLFTPVDCSVLLVRDRRELREAFAHTPEYLRTAEMEETVHLMDYGPALGRRFRALKLWFVLRYFGAEGIRQRLREHLRLARRLADRVDGEPGWERMAPVPFSTVVLRFAPGTGGEEEDALNQAILDRVNASGEVFLSHTRVGGRLALRVSVGHLATGERHLDRAWALLREAASELAPTPGRAPTPPSPPAPATPSPPSRP